MTQALAYSDYEDVRPRRSPANLLTRDEGSANRGPTSPKCRDCYDGRGLIECFGDTILGAEARERELVTFAKWRARAREV